MKTAMQELIEDLQKEFLKSGLNLNIEPFKPFLEKEKEQIIEAHEEGFYSPPFKKSRRGEALEYYNQTYNQNK